MSFFLILKTKEIVLGIVTLLSFGGGGIVYYALNKKGNKKIEKSEKITIKESPRKLIFLLLGCLIFVICCYGFLPFNHLFDDNYKYTPALGYIVGITGILFFGFGFVTAIIRLVKPRTIMQISDEGLLIVKNKKQELIYWEAIAETSSNHKYLFIHMDSPHFAVDRTISIPINLIEYNIDEIENLIREKRIENL